MNDLNEHFQQELENYLKERQGLIDEVEQLKGGDDLGLFYSADPNREPMLSGQQRIAKMIETRIGKICELERDIKEHCRLTKLENPIPKGRTV